MSALDQNFWSNVVRRTAQSFLSLIRGVDSRREPEIAKLQDHVTVYEDISELEKRVEAWQIEPCRHLQISVNHFHLVV